VAGPFLAVLAGVVLTLFFRVLANGITPDNGVAPYSALLLLAVGVAGASIVFVPFFLYFPVRGGALQIRHYFKGTAKHHLLGLCSGILGGAAVLSYMLARGAPANAQAGPVLSHLLSFGAPVVAAIWGMFVWREFAGAFFRVSVVFVVSVILLVASLGMVAVAMI
jgi:glucose uptake protein